jgi:hypothetical protein
MRVLGIPVTLVLVLGLGLGLGCQTSSAIGDAGIDAGVPAPDAGPSWLQSAKILVPGEDVTNQDCRVAICPHNENTDLVNYRDAIFLVHRTAVSQVLGPNSALHVYRSDDGGAHFTETAVILAPVDRDLRDPHFFIVDGNLHMVAITRLPVVSSRDSNVDSVSVDTFSSDGGKTWSPLRPIAPATNSFWRARAHDGVFYSAAYLDGDRAVTLFHSDDGASWKAGATIYDVAADTPLETELVFMPQGLLLAIVRMDGTDDELLGSSGRLRTALCWAKPPAYDAFDCSQTLEGVRLDGPLAFFWQGRLLVVARKHLPVGYKKRTALYELTGDFDHQGKLAIVEHGELPSAGDTAYAGVATIDATHVLVTWYSSDILDDRAWALAMLLPADIWQATLDLGRLPSK